MPKKFAIIYLMPEETVDNQPVPSSSDSNSAKKTGSSKIFAVILLILVIGLVATLSYFYFFNKKQENETKVKTGLTREQITLGWTSLTGTYPNNSSSPTSDDVNFNDSIFEALTKARGSEIVPSLATKWTNPSSTTWRFEIQSGVKFQSGDSLTTEDVKYSFDQAIESADTDNPWSSANSISTIKEVRVIDNKTIEIETTHPDPILLNRLTDVFILSKKQIEKDGLTKAVGTGPYKVDSFETDTKAVVSLNENYWGNKPKVKKATFLVYEDDQALLKALREGKIDYAKIGTANEVVPSGFIATKFDDPRVVMLFFNFAAKTNKGKPNPLLTKSVREAVKMALDSKKVIKEASVSGTVANQFVTKEIVGYNNKIREQLRNIATTKQLLLDNSIDNLSFDLYTTSDRKPVADSIASQLLEAGITVKVMVSENFGALVKKLGTGEIAAFIAGPAAYDGGEYIDSILKTDADQNILSYSNPEIDSGIEKANKTFVPRERREILESLVEKIVSDVPVIPLYSVTNTYIMKSNFDFKLSAFADFALENVSGREEILPPSY